MKKRYMETIKNHILNMSVRMQKFRDKQTICAMANQWWYSLNKDQQISIYKIFKDKK